MTNPRNTPLPTSKLEGVHNNAPSHRERDEHYAHVIATPAPRWRIIVCKHGLQWIVQKRSTEAPNTGVWVGFSHCTTRNALIEACSRLDLLSDANTEAVLHALPERITGTPS